MDNYNPHFRAKKIVPLADERYRVTRSDQLWIISRYFSPPNGRLDSYTILDSIERSVYTFYPSGIEHVRYLNRLHVLHSVEEFNALLLGARNGQYSLHNNQGYDDEHEYSSDEILRFTKVATFIFTDEKGDWV